MTWPLKCDNSELGVNLRNTTADVMCEWKPISTYIICTVICCCPFITLACFPLAKKKIYLSVTIFALAFGMSLATGSLFFLLFPSCLEDRTKITNPHQHDVNRHVGAIMCSMVWFFFIFDRLAKFFFAKQIFQSRHHVETDPNILEHEPRFHYDRKSVNWNTTGGRITISGRMTMDYRFAKAATGRLSRISFADHHADHHAAAISEVQMAANAQTGITDLPHIMKHGRIRLPKWKDFTVSGLSNVSPIAWLLFINNCLSAFTVGLVISAAIYNSLAEGIIISISFILQDIIHRIGDYIILSKNGMNPLQALASNFLSSSWSYFGGICGLFIIEHYGTQWVFVVGSGYFMFNSFGVILPELDEADARMIAADEKPIKPFLLQNVGLALGFTMCAIFAYAEFDLDFPW